MKRDTARKTFLHPRRMRRGAPIMHFVKREGTKFWLGTYHDRVSRLRTPILQSLSKRKFQGIGSEYNGVSESRISKGLYLVLLAEAIFNTRKPNN